MVSHMCIVYDSLSRFRFLTSVPKIHSSLHPNGINDFLGSTWTLYLFVLSNSSGSGKVYKVNSLFVSNTDTANSVNVTVNYYDSSSVSAATTSGSIAGTIAVPAKSNLIILDKSNTLYLEENKSIGSIAGTAAKLTVICTYEDIS